MIIKLLRDIRNGKKATKLCDINHDGFSEKMEKVGTTDIFLRSVDKRNMKYVTFVGDGDSASFGTVKEACLNVYGNEYVVQKEECVGHIQKRMGTALRKLKRKSKGILLADNKTIGDKGRLTDVYIDSIQNYYGQAIRNNNDIVSMQNAIWAIFHHMILPEEAIPLPEQHQYCPRDSWCKFWASNAMYKEDSRLPSVFKLLLKQIFSRLSNNDILGRCLKGLTQNQNEAINGMLWAVCPKTKFCGRSKVLLAVADTVLKWNSGAGNKLILYNDLGISPGINTLSYLHQEDNIRIKNSERKVAMPNHIARRKQRAQKKAKKGKTATTYLAGGFGVSTTPDVIDFGVNIEVIKVTFIDDSDTTMIADFMR